MLRLVGFVMAVSCTEWLLDYERYRKIMKSR